MRQHNPFVLGCNLFDIYLYMCVCLMCAFHVRTQVRDRINTIHNTTDFSKRKSLYEPRAGCNEKLQQSTTRLLLSEKELLASFESKRS